MSQGRVPLSQTESAKDSGHSLAKNTALMHAIRDERTRRVRNGVAAQEAACKYFIKAPKILDEIMTNEHSNARHKIEAVTGN